MTSEEVRIYPLVRLRGDGKKSSFVNRIMKDLEIKADFEIVPVDYRFRKGGNIMMKIIQKKLIFLDFLLK